MKGFNFNFALNTRQRLSENLRYVVKFHLIAGLHYYSLKNINAQDYIHNVLEPITIPQFQYLKKKQFSNRIMSDLIQQQSLPNSMVILKLSSYLGQLRLQNFHPFKIMELDRYKIGLTSISRVKQQATGPFLSF